MYFDRNIRRPFTVGGVVIWITLLCLLLGLICSQEALPKTQPLSLLNGWGWMLLVLFTMWTGGRIGYLVLGNAEGSILGLAAVVTLWVLIPLTLL